MKNIVELFKMLGIEEVVINDDVKFLSNTPRRQLRRFEQLPIVHHPECKQAGDQALRCRCTKTTRLRVRVPA